MTREELSEVLRLHKLWLDGDKNGKRANFEGADLREANLRGANLRWADMQGADLRGADLQLADLRWADMRGADLQLADLRWADMQGADLREADMRGADLREADMRGADLLGANLLGADIDYSCWPLWCGSLDVKVDKRIAAQLAYHFCRLDCDDPEYLAAREAIKGFANQFHRVEECGVIR